jgi:hypothetical protein
MCRMSSCTNLSRDRNLINWVTQCANLSNGAKLKPILYSLGFGIKYGMGQSSPAHNCILRFFRWTDKLILNFVCLVWNIAISLATYRFYPRKWLMTRNNVT